MILVNFLTCTTVVAFDKEDKNVVLNIMGQVFGSCLKMKNNL